MRSDPELVPFFKCHACFQPTGSWWLELTFRLEYGDWVHGRTSQSRVSLTSLHSLLLLVTLVEMPVPQLLEHWDQGVVWTMHFWPSNMWTSGCGLKAVVQGRQNILASYIF